MKIRIEHFAYACVITLAAVGLILLWSELGQRAERMESSELSQCEGIHGYLRYNGERCGEYMQKKIIELEERIKELEK